MGMNEQIQNQMREEILRLSQAVSALVEKFHQIRSPLLDSHGKVPQASTQLDKITAQTEAATHQMLDHIETMTRRGEELIDITQQARSTLNDNDVATVVSQLDQIEALANDNLTDAFSVLDSLQFQDITAQQIDHAGSLLDDIETQLRSLLSSMGEDPAVLAALTPPERKRAFDPHADLFSQKTKQEDIDSMFSTNDEQ